MKIAQVIGIFGIFIPILAAFAIAYIMDAYDK